MSISLFVFILNSSIGYLQTSSRVCWSASSSVKLCKVMATVVTMATIIVESIAYDMKCRLTSWVADVSCSLCQPHHEQLHRIARFRRTTHEWGWVGDQRVLGCETTELAWRKQTVQSANQLQKSAAPGCLVRPCELRSASTGLWCRTRPTSH